MSEKALYRQVGLGRWELLHRGVYPAEGRHFHPPTNVVETDDLVVVTLEVAGLQEGEYEISLSDSDRLLTIVGRRQQPDVVSKRLVYHRLEIQFGEFLAQVHLPWPIEQAETVEATYEDGFLTIVLPKAKPRQVAVRFVGA
jgi:HSP20 family molecular chaperone IbpA